MNHVPSSKFQYAIGLKAIGIFAFPAMAAMAAILERPVAVLLLLAIFMSLTGVIQRRIAMRAAGHQQRIDPRALASGIGARLIGLIAVFIVTIGVLALFRDTSLARTLGPVDALLVLLPTIIALGSDFLLAHTMKTELAAAKDVFEAAKSSRHAGPGRPSETGGPIIEGEIIDPPTD